MQPNDIREKLADQIARRAIAGKLLNLVTHAYALDLGLDVQAIERKPLDHIIPKESS